MQQREIQPVEYTIEQLQEQETLRFLSMTKEDAAELGAVAIEIIRQGGLSLAADIVLDGDLVFRAKLGNTGPGNDDWLRRKAATARQFGRSSMLVRRELERDDERLDDAADDDGVPLAAFGGAFPIRVGHALMGTITMSGEPDWVDHFAVVEAVRRYLAR